MKGNELNNGAAVNTFWLGFFYLVFHQVLKNNSSSNADF